MERSDCPIANALDLWGDKWSLLLIRDMMFEGKRHYGEFLQAAEEISTNILADRLLRLEKAAIVIKHKDETNKTRYIYTLTEKGVDLLPVIVEIAMWSLHYNDHTTLNPHIVAQIKADKAKFIQTIRTALLSASVEP
ncbi:MAG: helix-turn-helix domain-containing protein [Chloroflexota bacterium]